MDVKDDYQLFTRLMSHVIEVNGCWIWTAYCDSKGYSRVRIGSHKNNSRIMTSAHILMYELFNLIPDNHELDHLCRNRKCINPNHLEPVSHRENVLRGEGLAALNKVKTRCKRNHSFNLENTRWYGNKRYCIACEKLRTLSRKR